MQRLYAYALPGLTARQLFNSSTLLDSSTARQNSTELSTELDRPRHPGTCSQSRLALTCSTATRQLLDRLDRNSTGKALTAPRQHLDSGSTEPRQLDSSTARAQERVAAGRGAKEYENDKNCTPTTGEKRASRESHIVALCGYDPNMDPNATPEQICRTLIGKIDARSRCSQFVRALFDL